MDIKWYWVNKKERANIAVKHTKEMEEKYHSEIEECYKNSTIYSFDSNFSFSKKLTTPTGVIGGGVINLDSVGAIMAYPGKTAILNFASYKEPGGGFILGSRAQEECLCHASYLYNVLKRFQSYYDWNDKNKNRGLYLNRAIYSPNVRFEQDSLSTYCDVITCAAPNYSIGIKYGNISKEENTNALDERIKFVLDIAAENNVKTLILGAFGCGVFAQDPEEVATIFKKYLSTEYKCFKTVIFAIPDNVNKENYNAFYKVLVKN